MPSIGPSHLRKFHPVYISQFLDLTDDPITNQYFSSSETFFYTLQEYIRWWNDKTQISPDLNFLSQNHTKMHIWTIKYLIEIAFSVEKATLHSPMSAYLFACMSVCLSVCLSGSKTHQQLEIIILYNSSFIHLHSSLILHHSSLILHHSSFTLHHSFIPPSFRNF